MSRIPNGGGGGVRWPGREVERGEGWERGEERDEETMWNA